MPSAVPVDVARAPTRWLRRALMALVVISAAYAAAVVWLMTQETELVFRTDVAKADVRPSFPYEQIEVPRADRARQFAWRMMRDKADATGEAAEIWVLYLHGNAS